jgi:hypothetical protein
LCECLDVQPDPRLDSLIERNPRHHAPAVTQHHHEHPRAANLAGHGVPEPPDLPEVHLRVLSRPRLDGDRDVFSANTPIAPQSLDQALDGPVGAVEVSMVEAEPIVDGAGTDGQLGGPADGQRWPPCRRGPPHPPPVRRSLDRQLGRPADGQLGRPVVNLAAPLLDTYPGPSQHVPRRGEASPHQTSFCEHAQDVSVAGSPKPA